MVRHAYKWYAFRRKYVRIRSSKRGAAAMQQASDERSFCRRFAGASMRFMSWGRRFASKGLRLFTFALKPADWLKLPYKLFSKLVSPFVWLLKLMIRLVSKPVRVFAKWL